MSAPTADFLALPAPLPQLFTAETERDWEHVRSTLHPDVTWTINKAGAQEIVVGVEEYVIRLRAAYEEKAALPFTMRRAIVDPQGCVVTELVDEVGNVSVDVFLLKDGLILQEWEYLFGPDPAVISPVPTS